MQVQAKTISKIFSASGGGLSFLVGLCLATSCLSEFTLLGLFYALPIFLLSLAGTWAGFLAFDKNNTGRVKRGIFLQLIVAGVGYSYFLRGNAPLLWVPSSILFIAASLIALFNKAD